MVDVELTPAQEAEIEGAVAGALAAAAPPAPDPWWQAGLDDALET